MSRKNLLSLHEAIVVALINQPSRTANFEEIAKFIIERNLYPNRKGNIPLSTQVMLRSTKAKGAYSHLFEDIGANHIRLRDSYNDFAIQFYNGFEAILKHNKHFFDPPGKSFKVVDVEFEINRKILIRPNDVICVISKDEEGKKSGRKKMIYLREPDAEKINSIKKYTIQTSLEKLYTEIDPLSNYLAIVSKDAIVNVGDFSLSKFKVLKPNGPTVRLLNLPIIKFSDSPIARNYLEKFILVERSYTNSILLQKTAIAYLKAIGLNS